MTPRLKPIRLSEIAVSDPSTLEGLTQFPLRYDAGLLASC